MSVRCWQCSEELDTSSVEREVYNRLIIDLRSLMCQTSHNDYCDLWWRHESCDTLQGLIAELKEKLL
jgi:hypothetical protein